MAAACDAGKRTEEKFLGPRITILGANVGPDKPLPQGGVIQVSFDRYLLPSTVTRQAVTLVDANDQVVTGENAPLVTYDPIARTVTLSRPKNDWLIPGQPYRIVLPIPPDDQTDDRGLRAIDRATLDPNQPREIAFFVESSDAGAAPPPHGEPNVSFCTDVLPIFVAKCSEPSCHGGGFDATPAAGLVLDSARGVEQTALGRVAQGANTGARAGFGDEAGKVFGINMKVIEPKEPGKSWLLYKIDLAPAPVIDAGIPAPDIVCPPPAGVAPSAPAPPGAFLPAAPARIYADEIEREILNDHVLGREMPYPRLGVTGPSGQPLTFDERERIRVWITRGATVEQCGGCGEVLAPAADAGAGDGG